jgi:hypothetical protein
MEILLNNKGRGGASLSIPPLAKDFAQNQIKCFKTNNSPDNERGRKKGENYRRMFRIAKLLRECQIKTE